MNRYLAAMLFTIFAVSSPGQAIRDPNSSGLTVTPPSGGTVVDLCAGQDPCPQDALIYYDAAAACWKCASLYNSDPAALSAADGSVLDIFIDEDGSGGRNGDEPSMRLNDAGTPGVFIQAGNTSSEPVLLMPVTGEVLLASGTGATQLVVAGRGTSGVVVGDASGALMAIDDGVVSITGTALRLDLDSTVSGGIRGEGATADAFEFSLLFPDVASDLSLTLPSDDPDANDVLQSDTNGVTSWVAPSTLFDADGSSATCNTGSNAPGAAPGGYLCLFPYFDDSGGSTASDHDVAYYIPDHTIGADPDPLSAVNDKDGVNYWGLRCDGDRSDNYANCVISLGAKYTGHHATANEPGPELTLSGADAQGSEGIGTARGGNSVQLSNGSLGNSSTDGGQDFGGTVHVQNRHRFGVLCLSSRNDANEDFVTLMMEASGSDAAVCDGTLDSRAITNDNSGMSYTEGFRFYNSSNTGGSSSGDNRNYPIIIDRVVDSSPDANPSIVVRANTLIAGFEHFLFFTPATADREITFPDSSGTVALFGGGSETLADADFDNGSTDLFVADELGVESTIFTDTGVQIVQDVYSDGLIQAGDTILIYSGTGTNNSVGLESYGASIANVSTYAAEDGTDSAEIATNFKSQPTATNGGSNFSYWADARSSGQTAVAIRMEGIVDRVVRYTDGSNSNTLAWATPSGNTTWTLPAVTDTVVGKATTDTFTNKTYDTAGTGNVFKMTRQVELPINSACSGVNGTVTQGEVNTILGGTLTNWDGWVVEFTDAGSTYMVCTMPVPDDFDASAPVQLKLHGFPKENDGAGAVDFEVEADEVSDAETIDVSWAGYEATGGDLDLNVSAVRNERDSTAWFTLTESLAVGDLLVMKVRRDTSDASDVPVFVHSVEVKFGISQ